MQLSSRQRPLGGWNPRFHFSSPSPTRHSRSAGNSACIFRMKARISSWRKRRLLKEGFPDRLPSHCRECRSAQVNRPEARLLTRAVLGDDEIDCADALIAQHLSPAWPWSASASSARICFAGRESGRLHSGRECFFSSGLWICADSVLHIRSLIFYEFFSVNISIQTEVEKLARQATASHKVRMQTIPRRCYSGIEALPRRGLPPPRDRGRAGSRGNRACGRGRSGWRRRWAVRIPRPSGRGDSVCLEGVSGTPVKARLGATFRRIYPFKLGSYAIRCVDIE